MRRLARRDANHAAVVRALRAAGCSVLELHQLGSGVPDLLVGCRGWDYLIEVKAPDDRGRLTAGAERSRVGQVEWAERWRGHPVAFVTGPLDALRKLGLAAGLPPV